MMWLYIYYSTGAGQLLFSTLHSCLESCNLKFGWFLAQQNQPLKVIIWNLSVFQVHKTSLKVIIRKLSVFQLYIQVPLKLIGRTVHSIFSSVCFQVIVSWCLGTMYIHIHTYTTMWEACELRFIISNYNIIEAQKCSLHPDTNIFF